MNRKQLEQQYKKLLKLKKEQENRRKKNPIHYYNNADTGKVHLKQIEFHKSEKRNRWMFGGNRTGKTVSGAAETVYWALGIHPYKKVPLPNRGWVVSLSNEVQRDVAQREILKWLPPDSIVDVAVRMGRKDDPENAVLDYLLVKNIEGSISKIAFKSCDQGRAKFQGTSQNYIWFDEEPPKDIFDECKMRILDTNGYIWGTMTPLMGLTWVYDIIYLNENDDPEVWYQMMQWRDNPYLSPQAITALESTMTEEEREARQYGKFVALSGLIYKEFREEIHVIDPFNVPKEWYDNISIDPGYTNPLSCHFYACDEEGNVYVIDEHYEAERSVEYHAKKIYEIADRLKWPRSRTGKLNTLIDSAANQRGLNAEKSVIDLFWDHNINCDARVEKDVWTGIQRVKQYLKMRDHPEKELYPKGKPKLFIFRNCVKMIKEIKSYRWAENKDNANAHEKPKKYNDHAMDEMRYYIMSKPEPYETPKKPLTGYYTETELEDMGMKPHEIKEYMEGMKSWRQ